MGTQILLPQGKWELTKDSGAPLVVVAGGRRPDPQWLRKAAGDLPLYAADRGADHCAKAGLTPRFLYGDRDSAAPGAWEKFVQAGAKVKTFPVNKDDTDLSLILQDIKVPCLVLATGVWGGRADHLFGNLYCLLSCQKRGSTVILADEQEILCFLGPGEGAAFTPAGRRPAAVSLLPLTAETTVSIEGVRWLLDHSSLTQENPYAVSNKMTEAVLTASCQAGWAGLYLTWKE